MSAAENNGVDSGFSHWIEILVSDGQQLRSSGNAAFDVLDEARARLLSEHRASAPRRTHRRTRRT